MRAVVVAPLGLITALALHGLVAPTAARALRHSVPLRARAVRAVRRAVRLLRHWATATRRAAVALDKLAITTGSPSSMLALARRSVGSPVTARQPADEGRRAQAQPAPLSDVGQPRA